MTGTRPDINGAATDRKRHKRTEFPKTGDYCLPFTMLKPLRLFNPLPVKSNGTGLGISPPKRRPSNKPKDQSPN
ncbi:hypothetical protein Bca4012_066745 [Brassica carinata]